MGYCCARKTGGIWLFFQEEAFVIDFEEKQQPVAVLGSSSFFSSFTAPLE